MTVESGDLKDRYMGLFNVAVMAAAALDTARRGEPDTAFIASAMNMLAQHGVHADMWRPIGTPPDALSKADLAMAKLLGISEDRAREIAAEVAGWKPDEHEAYNLDDGRDANLLDAFYETGGASE